MKHRVITGWKFLHYAIYALLRSGQRKVNRLTFYYHKSNTIQKIWAKRGVYGEENIKKQLEFDTINPKNSSISILAGIHTGGIFCILLFSAINYIVSIFDVSAEEYFSNSVVVISTLILLASGIFNYYVLFKNDKYLDDFKKFDEIPVSNLIIFIFITLLFILFVSIFFVFSVLELMK